MIRCISTMRCWRRIENSKTIFYSSSAFLFKGIEECIFKRSFDVRTEFKACALHLKGQIERRRNHTMQPRRNASRFVDWKFERACLPAAAVQTHGPHWLMCAFSLIGQKPKQPNGIIKRIERCNRKILGIWKRKWPSNRSTIIDRMAQKRAESTKGTRTKHTGWSDRSNVRATKKNAPKIVSYWKNKAGYRCTAQCPVCVSSQSSQSSQSSNFKARTT